MLQPTIDIAPEEFWGDPTGSLEHAVSSALEKDAAGIALAAPERVVLGRHTTLPLCGVYVASIETVLRVPLYKAVVIASCVETGEVRMFVAAEMPIRDEEGEAEEAGEGSTGSSFQLDLFGEAGIPQRAATWVVRALLNDRVSNAVTVSIELPRNRFQDPAAAELLRELLRKPILRALNPRPSLGPGLPSYEPLPETPPVPEAPGIELKVKRAQLLEPKSQLLVHGSFHTQVLHRDVRPPPSADAPKLRGPRATAVVPMALVAINSDQVGAKITQLVIPSFQPLQGDAESPRGVGAFAFDYFQLTSVPVASHTLFLYAFAGPLMSPVAPCALVDPAAAHTA
jgi:hypothetical protein